MLDKVSSLVQKLHKRAFLGAKTHTSQCPSGWETTIINVFHGLEHNKMLSREPKK